MTTPRRVSDLPALVVPAAEDLLLIVDDPSVDPESKKITFGNLTRDITSNNITVNNEVVLTQLSLGLGSTNTTITPSSVKVGGAAFNTSITSTSIRVGNSTVNTVITAGNIALNGSQLTIGNTSVNTTLTGQALVIGNTSSNVTIGSNGTILVSGVQIVNSTGGWTGSGTANTGDITFEGTTISSEENMDFDVSGQLIVDANDIVIIANEINLQNYSNSESTIIETDSGNNVYQWEFGANGTLELPGNSIISEGEIDGQPTLELQPPATNTSSADQKLVIKGGNGGDPEDYHLHLTTANNESISLFLGTDNQYVKIDSTGDVITEAKQDQYVRLYTTNENRSFEVSLGPDGTLTTPKLKIDQGVRERLQIKNDATGVIEHDCSDGHIFYHTSIDANFTANFTNLSLENSEATSLTLVLSQGGTAYIANSVQIANVAQTIKWYNDSIPTGNANSVDVLSFSVLRVSDNYIVLGQLTSFG